MADANEVGFTAEDRKILYQVEVRMQRLEGDVRDVRSEVREGMSRIARLEADRVGRKDVEDLLQVIEEKQDDNAALAKQNAQFEIRIAELEKVKPDVEMLKKYLWVAFGALAVLEGLWSFVFKK